MDMLTYIEKHFRFVSIFFLYCRQNHTVVRRIEYEMEQNVVRIIMTSHAGLLNLNPILCVHWTLNIHSTPVLSLMLRNAGGLPSLLCHSSDKMYQCGPWT